MATTRPKESRQKKLTTTPPPTPSDTRRQTTRPSPTSSTRSSRSTTPTSPRRRRSLTSSTGTKPLPNYLKPTESSRSISSARLTDSSSKLLKKHTPTTTTTGHGHETNTNVHKAAAINRRSSLDRAPSSSPSLPSPHHVHSRVSTSGSTPRERLATKSRPAPAPTRVSSRAPKTTAAVSNNKSHISSSGLGKSTVKKTTATTTRKEIPEIESSNALEKVSSSAGSIDHEQTPSGEEIQELKDIQQNKLGDGEEEIIQDMEYPEHPENEDISETEIENIKDDILEPEAFGSPVEESHNAVQTRQIEETMEEDKILEPENDNNNSGSANHDEDNGEEMDEKEGENKSVSPPVKEGSPGETELKAEDDCQEDGDENLDHAVEKDEIILAPEVHEEDARDEAETCSDKEEVVVMEDGVAAEKPVPVEEPAKTSTGVVSKGTGKKDSPAYNDVIEETASKLLEKRKNKVKALVGAFETVISLDSN